MDQLQLQFSNGILGLQFGDILRVLENTVFQLSRKLKKFDYFLQCWEWKSTLERQVDIKCIVIPWAIQTDFYLFSRDFLQFFLFFLLFLVPN